MAGWRIRHGVSGDVPFFAVALVIFGGLVATVVHLVVDLVIHRHRAV